MRTRKIRIFSTFSVVVRLTMCYILEQQFNFNSPFTNSQYLQNKTFSEMNCLKTTSYYLQFYSRHGLNVSNNNMNLKLRVPSALQKRASGCQLVHRTLKSISAKRNVLKFCGCQAPLAGTRAKCQINLFFFFAMIDSPEILET